MQYNLYFDMSAIMITLVIQLAAVISEWIPTYRNRSYRNLVRGVFLTALFDYVTCALETYQFQSHFWYIPAKYFFDSGYHLFHIMTGMFFVWFTFSIINLKVDTLRRKVILFGPILITEILLVLNLFFPVIFSYTAGGIYQRAPLIAIIYVFGFYYLGIAIAIMIVHRRSIERKVIAIMSAYAVIVLLGIVINTVLPTFMVGEFFNSMALILTYVNVESADEIKDDRYQIMTRHAYLREISRSMENGNPFLSIFVHINDMHETETNGGEHAHMAIMKDVIAFLKQYKKEAWLSVWNDSCIVLDMMHISEARAQQIMNEIEERFRSTWNRGSFAQTLGLTEWMVRYPQDISSVEELARKSEILNDIRLHRHRGQVRFSEISFDEIGFAARMMDLAAEAIRKRTVEERYAPVYDVRQDCIVSARAVLFFPDEKGNLIDGNTFINPSAPSQLLAAFDEYAFTNAAQVQQGLMKDTTLEEVSTRITLATLSGPDVETSLKRICQRHSADPTKMMFRISDGMYAQLNEEQLQILRRMRDHGWILAIDDFGMGQSFLSRISDSEISYLIMHQAVTRSILSSENGRRLGRGIADMVHGMHKTLTMTGIETAEQAKTAIALGADYLAGPYIGMPMPVKEFRSWMNTFCGLAEREAEYGIQ